MELVAQLWIAVFAAVLLLVFLRETPEIGALRWWFGAAVAAVATILLDVVASAQPASALTTTILLVSFLAGSTQIYCVARGFLFLPAAKPRYTFLSLVAGYGVLFGFMIVALINSPGQRLDAIAESRGLVIPIVCGILAFHLWPKRDGGTRVVLAVSAVLVMEFGRGILQRAADLQLFSDGISHLLLRDLHLSSGTWGIIGQCGAALTLVYLTVSETRAHDSELRALSRRLETLVDSADCGICELAPDGVVTFVNATGADILGDSRDVLPGKSILQMLEVPIDDGSALSLSNFTLRPTAAVVRARTALRRADGRSSIAEWCSVPFTRDGISAGSVMTVRDVTEQECESRFTNLRNQLLEMIARNKPVEEVLHALVSGVEERLAEFQCSVLVCEGDCLRLAAASPRLPEPFRIELKELPCSRFVRQRVGAGRDWQNKLRTLAPKFGFAGVWIEPMISPANELLGAVMLNHREAVSLSSQQTKATVDAARLAALAVEHRRYFERLLHQGHHDSLTGLPNRVLLADRLKQALARAERARSSLALLCIDLDRFKSVNDSLGHNIGDLFLQQISVRLAARIRTSDTLARTGGDEFTAILSDIRNPHAAERVADSLIAALSDPFDVEGHTLYGAASIGIALYPQDGSDTDTLQRNADRAMYRAKAQGSNTVQFYSSDEVHEGPDRIELEYHLHRAIEQGNFSLNFQPQFTCDQHLSGFEALLRFRHPKLGMIPPTRFIPMAEESGLILPIGEWVLREVCRQINEWQEKGMRPVRVAVNVSPLQFARSDFSATVANALHEYKVKPELLELELTEGVLMSNVRDSKHQMEALAQLGVRLSVDDFGTGYSSLSYLHQLPLHMLKIDRSFITKMLVPGGTRSIVEAIISLAHRMGLETIAEGVELQEQLSILRESGCDLIQGFLFAHPLTSIEASRLLWEDTVTGPGIAKKADSKLPKVRSAGRAALRFRSGLRS